MDSKWFKWTLIKIEKKSKKWHWNNIRRSGIKIGWFRLYKSLFSVLHKPCHGSCESVWLHNTRFKFYCRLSSPNFRLKGWSCRFFGGPELFFVVFHGWSATVALLHIWYCINIVLPMSLMGNDSVNIIQYMIYCISYAAFGSDTVLFWRI